MILVDTNLLLRLIEPGQAQRAVAVEAIEHLDDLGHRLIVVPQVIYEFWSVGTRPIDRNGLGMSTEELVSRLEGLMSNLTLFRDERTIFEFWQQLVIDHDVKGKQVHDARLVAAMLRHAVSHLLTFNAADFARYSEITVVEPDAVGALGPAE